MILCLYFSVQSKTISYASVSRIGLRGVFDGSVEVLIRAIEDSKSLTDDCDGQIMYVRYICVSSGAPCAQPHNNPTYTIKNSHK
jgi:hypothetical protein